jgi:putative sigma-54 modulation protein
MNRSRDQVFQRLLLQGSDGEIRCSFLGNFDNIYWRWLMDIHIRSRNLALSDSVRAHMARRMQFSLRRFALRIIKVTLQIAGINGPKGVHEKHCRVQVRLRPRGTLFAEYTDENLYAAIDRASGIVERAVIRAIQRIRKLGRPAKALPRPPLLPHPSF